MPPTSEQKQRIVNTYNGKNLKLLVGELNLTEHYIKKVARENGLIKKRRPLVPFNEQLVQIKVSVKRKNVNQALQEINPVIQKYRS